MSNHDDISSWPEYRLHILNELDRLDKGLEKLTENHALAFQEIKNQINGLKVDLVEGLFQLKEVVEQETRTRIDLLSSRVDDIRSDVTDLETGRAKMVAVAAAYSSAISIGVGIIGLIIMHYQNIMPVR